ncbi:hypothetical protein B9Z19DRAFT_1063486 [Tuber borchii]|uniref:Uncharacterized protein n=1 Tax=Tuber borchii TaxID=42251 RepID=A0A2T6ZYA5_TUBBO|nr:hypothetical protein B9Z19DRAFT_1063486 [Tuber borchii]
MLRAPFKTRRKVKVLTGLHNNQIPDGEEAAEGITTIRSETGEPIDFSSLLPMVPDSDFATPIIVRNNPKELTVHFGEQLGKIIRQNYMSMTLESFDPAPSNNLGKIFKNFPERTTSHTYLSPAGLLSRTQFTPPAITLTEKAPIEDIKYCG